MLKDLTTIGNITKIEEGWLPRPRIRLANGVTLSVQASKYHYCCPRENLPFDQYDSFEIGFPSQHIEALDGYCEGNLTTDECDVFAYVPKDVLLSIVEQAGGVIGLADDYDILDEGIIK